MLVSNCCGARFHEPDYPDNDICTACGDHASPEKTNYNLIKQRVDRENHLIGGREKILFVKKEKLNNG